MLCHRLRQLLEPLTPKYFGEDTYIKLVDRKEANIVTVVQEAIAGIAASLLLVTKTLRSIDSFPSVIYAEDSTNTIKQPFKYSSFFLRGVFGATHPPRDSGIPGSE